MTQPNDAASIARAAYEAYVSKDRVAIEALIADGFHFSSPLDNRLDRATYFDRCWPNSNTTEGFDRNTEIITVRGSQIVELEVYFGWNLPHKAAVGGFVTTG